MSGGPSKPRFPQRPRFKSHRVQTVPKLWEVLVSNPGLVIVTLCFPPWIELEAEKSRILQLPISSVGWAAVLQNHTFTQCPRFKSPRVQTLPKLWKVIVSNPGLVIVTLCFPPWLELETQKTMVFQLPDSSMSWAAVLQNRSSLQVRIQQCAK